MENIMTNPNGNRGLAAGLRVAGLGLGLSLALLANFGDRAFSASAANSGIDPLEILDISVKNNILFIVDTSGSMAGTPENEGNIVGGDDVASRFYQTKSAVRQVINLNRGKANFGLATFHPDMREHFIDGGQSVVYVTQDPTGDLFKSNFAGAATPSNLAMAFTLGGQTASTTDGTVFNGPSWTPVNGTLLVAFITSSGTAALDPTTYTAHGATYTKLTLAANAFGTTHATSVWVAAAPAVPTATAGTATYASARTGTAIIEYSVTGVDLTGGPVNAVAQIRTDTGTGTTASTTFAAASDPANRQMFFTAHLAAQVTNPAAGWTELGDTNYATPNTGVEGQVRPGSYATAASATFATSSAWRVVGLELKTQPYDSCMGTLCTTTESSKIFSFFTSNSTVYPAGCTPQPAGNQVAVGGATNPPITHVPPTTSGAASTKNCRYYVKSRVMLAGKRYQVVRGNTAATAIKASQDITCPLPPARLLGDDVLPEEDGTKARACFQLQDETGATPTHTITTYWMTGTNFDFTNVAGASTNQCDQTGINISVAACDDSTAEDKISAMMRMELQYDINGVPIDMPARTNLDDRKPMINEVPSFQLDTVTGPPTNYGTVAAPIFRNPGIRQGNGTPLAKSMIFALGYFNNATTGILAAGGTVQRPVAAQGKQKQFVILLTDGDESCGGNAPAEAYKLWTNTAPALPACNAACLSAKGITAAQYAAANRIELILITFAGGSTGNVDAISRAGTGRNPSTNVCDPGAPCRTAYISNDLNQLVSQLNDAINQSTNTGEYSDQQSISESVYEFADLIQFPATPTAAAQPPGTYKAFDPLTRYGATYPVLFQSTFELPDFKGHLRAFGRTVAGTALPLWDAGQELYDRVADVTNGMNVPNAGICATAPSQGCHTFAALTGGVTTPVNIRSSIAKIKRRIYTTLRNGVNSGYTAANLLNNSGTNGTGTTDPTMVTLWPPTAAIAPQDNTTAGTFDEVFGLTALTTVAQVQAAVPGACQGYTPANINATCSNATVSIALGRARREAREIILAYLAGAQVFKQTGLPVRDPSTKELIYNVRPSVMAESTLAAPAVVAPALSGAPHDGYKEEEYKLFRDGMRLSTASTSTNGQPVNAIDNGLGLRNPDVVSSGATSVVTAAKENANLKPVMTVVYHVTNQGLHAIRGGPCPPLAGSGIGPASVACLGETGGEELWMFVPYDQLSKLAKLPLEFKRGVNKVYMLTSPIRFTDVFVPTPSGTLSPTIGTPATAITPAMTGVWRTMLVFGRGQGGKSYTALDVTTPGAFTKHSLDTNPPVVMWSRGNPDTTDGKPLSASNSVTHSTADYNAYLKMGETWSVPGVGFIGPVTPSVGHSTIASAARANFPSTRSVIPDFALFTGSGYSDVTKYVAPLPNPVEGQTFYALDPLTGDVLRSFDIADGTPQAPESTLTNFLVASPAVYTEAALDSFVSSFPLSPTGYRFSGNAVDARAKAVYFGDLHGRIWRYDAMNPAAAPTAFITAPPAAGNQPISVGVGILQASDGKQFVYAETGRDRRVASQASSAKLFKMYAYEDNAGSPVKVFEQNFPQNYRGTVQPATAFISATQPVVFYAGVRYTQACVSQFDSLLAAYKAITASAGLPIPAFDLNIGAVDDGMFFIPNVSIRDLSVPGGNLIISTNEGQPPPPPANPVQYPEGTGTGGGTVVRQGLDPKAAYYEKIMPTTVPFRSGSSVCRTEYQ